VASNGSSFAVVWEEPAGTRYYPYSHSQVFGVVIDSTGQVSAGGRKLLAPAPASLPDIASNGSQYLVAWTSGSNCHPIFDDCWFDTNLNVRARLFDTSLTPMAPAALVADQRETNDQHVEAASSGRDWLISWTAQSFRFPTIPRTHYLGETDAGYAVLDSNGLRTADFAPIAPEGRKRTSVSAAWTGRRYVMTWVENGEITVALLVAGLPPDIDAVTVARGTEPSIESAPGHAVLTYVDATGAVIMRDIDTQPTRPRAVRR
jgi:hypothetical protein